MKTMGDSKFLRTLALQIWSEPCFNEHSEVRSMLGSELIAAGIAKIKFDTNVGNQLSDMEATLKVCFDKNPDLATSMFERATEALDIQDQVRLGAIVCTVMLPFFDFIADHCDKIPPSSSTSLHELVLRCVNVYISVVSVDADSQEARGADGADVRDEDEENEQDDENDESADEVRIVITLRF